LKAGVVGASGYGGVELLRLLAGHPNFSVDVACASSQAGQPIATHTPSLAPHFPELRYAPTNRAELAGLDVVFLAMPHGASQSMVPELEGQVGTVVDLAADFRLTDPSAYPRWYGEEHLAPHLLPEFVYGLPELRPGALIGATRIAVAGCYPTAASLALAPLVAAGAVDADQPLIVDAARGVSGAGRVAKDHLHFSAVDEDFTAYGLLDHRHTPEIEQNLGAQVLFTPHLAPMNRGILATCYARPTGKATTASLLATLASFYRNEPFVTVNTNSPSTKATFGSNAVHITARFDERTGTVMVISAIDNLTKGASGGAVQAANVALGLEETAGLTNVGVYP
jgi:N-acetyl-gamma-glutamyl-phosphate reductase